MALSSSSSIVSFRLTRCRLVRNTSGKLGSSNPNASFNKFVFRPKPITAQLPVRIHGDSGSCESLVGGPLEAILFDIDGTICDSDPLHFYAFRQMLQEIGFNGGSPITEEFFIENISGKHNEQLCQVLLPHWELPRARQFMEDKEALFRRFAREQLQPVKGLPKLCKWIQDRGLKRAAVTNAPRPNADLLMSMLGLSDFFEILVLATECARPKPFPDAYLRALQDLGISHHNAFVFEDSVSGIKAGLSAGMHVVGLATRNPEKLLMKAGATFVIKDFENSKLWSALDELERGIATKKT